MSLSHTDIINVTHWYHKCHTLVSNVTHWHQTGYHICLYTTHTTFNLRIYTTNTLTNCRTYADQLPHYRCGTPTDKRCEATGYHICIYTTHTAYRYPIDGISYMYIYHTHCIQYAYIYHTYAVKLPFACWPTAALQLRHLLPGDPRRWAVSFWRLGGTNSQCVAVCCSVLQCVAVCCSVLQYVAVGL